MEPAIGREVVAGVHLPEVKAVSHPQELVRRFMQAAIARGSQLIAHEVQAIARESGRTGVLAAGSHYRFDKVVLAGGLWSRRFFRDLDVTVPMAAERGFHFQMTGFGNLLGRPVSFIDRRVVCSPMLEGLRLTTGAVFGGAKAAPEYRLARRIFDRAKHLIPALHDFTGREWSGFRPSTPDSVPIIGVSQTMPDVIIATGHGHGGLCLSGVTGRLVTMLANGTLEPGELAPLSPNRPISPSNDMKLAMSPLRLARHSLD
jgi:D-amino-acid dehydrogenase